MHRGLVRGPLIVLLAALPTVVMAATPDAARIAQSGNGHGAAPCMACHGTNGGGSAIAGYPRLAGLPAAYLRKQLDDFAAGSRENPVMGANARALSASERQAMATYYAAMPIPLAARKAPAETPSADGPGARLALRGRWSHNVPACVQCHGPGGIGVGTHFPPLAGQPAAYLLNQLKAWKNGTRRNDPLELMRHVAAPLDGADMKAVADWFAAQPAVTGEGAR